MQLKLDLRVWVRIVRNWFSYNNSRFRNCTECQSGPVCRWLGLTLCGCVVYVRPAEDGRWPPPSSHPRRRARNATSIPPLVMSCCISKNLHVTDGLRSNFKIPVIFVRVKAQESTTGLFFNWTIVVGRFRSWSLYFICDWWYCSGYSSRRVKQMYLWI